MNGASRRASSRSTGSCTEPTSSASSSSPSATGENAPMPPVFGPASPSKARLKSRAGGRPSAVTPSQIANTDNSSPSSSSSTTKSSPMPDTARSAASSSSCVRQMKTPLPAASPSALTTHGSRATASPSGVGTPAACMTSFAKRFEPSIRAAAALGPNTATPPSRSASATPDTSGTSGPITTRSIASARASASKPSASCACTGWHGPSPAIPGLPGAACSSVSRGLCASFQASACSRPPDPTTRTFTRRMLTAA